MVSFAIPSQIPSAYCSLKLRGRENGKKAISLATIYFVDHKSLDTKYHVFMISSTTPKFHSCLRLKSTIVSSVIVPVSSVDPEDEKVQDVEMEDIRVENPTWVDIYLPQKAKPYVRLSRQDKPIVTWLYAWPSLWAIALAATPGSLPNITLMALFGIASIFTRGYACTINDIFDRDVDKKVHRSKQRPIASGAVTLLQGIVFLFLQLFASLAVLYPVLNNFSKVMGVPVFPLFSTYPLMKRLTYWPQAYLGLAMNWIAIVGWSAIKGSIDLPVLIPLFISLILWTLTYDTIYAHQDRADDIKAGVKSTAVLFGDSTKMWCTVFSIICIGSLATSGFNAKIGWPFYASLVAASGHLAWQITTVDLSNSTDCKNKFISNIWFGAIVFIGACLGRLFN